MLCKIPGLKNVRTGLDYLQREVCCWHKLPQYLTCIYPQRVQLCVCQRSMYLNRSTAVGPHGPYQHCGELVCPRQHPELHPDLLPAAGQRVAGTHADLTGTYDQRKYRSRDYTSTSYTSQILSCQIYHIDIDRCKQCTISKSKNAMLVHTQRQHYINSCKALHFILHNIQLPT